MSFPQWVCRAMHSLSLCLSVCLSFSLSLSHTHTHSTYKNKHTHRLSPVWVWPSYANISHSPLFLSHSSSLSLFLSLSSSLSLFIALFSSLCGSVVGSAVLSPGVVMLSDNDVRLSLRTLTSIPAQQRLHSLSLSLSSSLSLSLWRSQTHRLRWAKGTQGLELSTAVSRLIHKHSPELLLTNNSKLNPSAPLPLLSLVSLTFTSEV